MSSGPSLYRRHRPRTFDDVVGQDHVVRTLRNAVEQGKVHHAYLFVGSRGTGKTSMAKILAACLNCRGADGTGSGPTVTPCGVCESCRSIAAATSLDVIEMDAASNNSVDDIRDLRERVAYAPVSGRHKVYILDEAHMLSSQAWNAFLKTLEEPPPNTIFVLATTEASKVLPTVVDRCHRFDFARPTVEQIASVIARVAAEERIEIGAGAVGLVARHATGSFRDALGTLEQLVTYADVNPGADPAHPGAAIETADVLAVLGVADQDVVFGTLDAVASGNAREALLAVDRTAETGRDLSSFARDLERQARELLVVQTLGEVPSQIAMTAEHDALLAEQAERVPGTVAIALLDLLNVALKAVRDGADARTQLELALVKAAAPEVDSGARALMSRIERLEAKLGAGSSATAVAAPPAAAPAPADIPAPPHVAAASPEPAPGSPPAAAAPAPSAPVVPPPAVAVAVAEPDTGDGPTLTAIADPEPDLDGVRAVWPAVLDQLRDENMVLATALSSGSPVSLDGSALVIAFSETDDFKRRKVDAESRVVAAAVRTFVGARIEVRTEIRERDEQNEPAHAVPTDDELVERFMTEFDAEEIVAEEHQS
ncbi:MAG TPA: DNA polymerase III subunit gamma/tau [Solirubrobacteraceae bacterium]|nr:DNA polymerase III subunit gamma/tau [Solirubrobacteraceae bacterium]